jgi:hypothetical protein
MTFAVNPPLPGPIGPAGVKVTIEDIRSAAYDEGERRGRERAAEAADAGAEVMDTPSQIARSIRNLPEEEPGT